VIHPEFLTPSNSNADLLDESDIDESEEDEGASTRALWDAKLESKSDEFDCFVNEKLSYQKDWVFNDDWHGIDRIFKYLSRSKYRSITDREKYERVG
jgi:hypothetical protein